MGFYTAAAGLGGVEITPIYGVRGFEDRNVAFLSPRWMELLSHTGREAQRLGLGVDMATGTGWPWASSRSISMVVPPRGTCASTASRCSARARPSS